MRLFLDANVLISVINKEYPAFTTCARVLSLADRKPFILYTSSLAIAITWYFAEKKLGQATARKKMTILLDHIQITGCGAEETRAAMALKKADDLEDGIQYFSALHSGCRHIITSNVRDFHFSVIPVWKPEDFLNQASLDLKY